MELEAVSAQLRKIGERIKANDPDYCNFTLFRNHDLVDVEVAGFWKRLFRRLTFKPTYDTYLLETKYPATTSNLRLYGRRVV